MSAFAELDTALRAKRPRETPERPATAFYTSRQWSDKWKLSLSHTMAKIATLTRAGEMECVIYRRMSLNGRCYPTPHYKQH